ncbi:FAD-dependent monooxygenase [Paractinoplanes maris]|uniref:FAD-dependent monooxygenase n=1 Tax=Paractinoplanes maris TaxID=1734446 RepID=UPI00202148A5|nr:FAD-dependent monooxygenase [Actinoplanes maris]
MKDETEVIIVGGGPVGLMLAAELRLGGVSTVVLERADARAGHPRALGLHARTLEQLAMRGLQEPFLAKGIRVPSWHFGFLRERLDLTRLDSPYPFMLAFPQDRTEAILEQRALELGARVLRGVSVTGLTQDADGVRVSVDGGPDRRAAWVVGADGAGSTVRRSAGIAFPGTDADTYAYLGDVRADAPPAPGYGLQNEKGALIVAPVPGGLLRFTGYDPEDQDAGRRELTLEDLREITVRIGGTDFGLHDPAWLSRFGNATRVAGQYRHGRVLLAGDAAHMHFPAGGVGLNLGLQDAMNLGWKLADVARGRAGDDLLDTYHDERRPWAEDVAEHTLAQTALITATSPTGQALRHLLGSLIDRLPDLSLILARRLAALDVHYGKEGQPVGSRVAETGDALLDGRPAELVVDDRRVMVRPDGYVGSLID